MKILFIEPNATSTAPTRTWADALTEINVSSIHLNPAKLSTQEFINQLNNVDCVLIQYYGFIPAYTIKQLSFAPILNKPLIRKWSGSDVLNSTRDPQTKSSTLQLDKIVSINLTSDPVLYPEIKALGLNCIVNEQIISFQNAPSLPPHPAKNILVYLPDMNRAFYGEEVITSLIQKHPETTFTIIADNDHSLAHHQNVKSMGWVSNMEPIWESSGLLIRITDHDGSSRMILEAMFRGKHIIHNRKREGIWFAESEEEVDKKLTGFIDNPTHNLTGLAIAKRISESDPVQQLYNNIKQAKVTFLNRLSALKNIARWHLTKS